MTDTHHRIQVRPRFHYPNRIVLHRYGHDPETIDAPLTGSGYTQELAEVTGRVATGHTESLIMLLADTTAVHSTTVSSNTRHSATVT